MGAPRLCLCYVMKPQHAHALLASPTSYKPKLLCEHGLTPAAPQQGLCTSTPNPSTSTLRKEKHGRDKGLLLGQPALTCHQKKHFPAAHTGTPSTDGCPAPKQGGTERGALRCGDVPPPNQGGHSPAAGQGAPSTRLCSEHNKGRRFWKTFVPLLDVMKLVKEHETACRGWEHPGLYEQCSRIPALYGKARCSPPPYTHPGRRFFIIFSWERWDKHKQPHQPYTQGVIREAAPITNQVRAKIKSVTKR